MEKDVQDLNDHYNRVLTVASQNYRMITLAFTKINILHDNLQKLLEHTNKLMEIVNKALQGLEQLSDFLILDQALHVLKASYNTVMEVNRYYQKRVGCCTWARHSIPVSPGGLRQNNHHHSTKLQFTALVSQ